MQTTRITITRISYREGPEDINHLLQYLGGSLGLFGARDKDKSCFRIFIALLKAVKGGMGGLSSDDIADQLGLTRATVIHHLKRLSEAGIVDHVEGQYALRVTNLEEMIVKIRRDVDKTMDDLQRIARYCDDKLGL